MKECRLNGTCQTLRGSDHPMWKGGISDLHPYVRSILFKKLGFFKMKKAEFACQKCESNTNLQVHHNKEKFSDILQRVINKLNKPNISLFENKSLIAKRVVEYHVKNKVSSIVLCGKCHVNEHKRSNFIK